MRIPKTEILVLLVEGLMTYGCSKKTEEKKTGTASDSTAGTTYDTALSAQSNPLIIKFITWPDTLTPQLGDLPSSLTWNFFDSTSKQKFSPTQMNILSLQVHQVGGDPRPEPALAVKSGNVGTTGEWFASECSKGE